MGSQLQLLRLPHSLQSAEGLGPKVTYPATAAAVVVAGGLSLVLYPRLLTSPLAPFIIAAWLGGNVFTRPAVEKVGAIGAEMKAGGGPPGAELIGRMDAAQQRLRTIGRITLALLAVSVIAMASARFLY